MNDRNGKRSPKSWKSIPPSKRPPPRPKLGQLQQEQQELTELFNDLTAPDDELPGHRPAAPDGEGAPKKANAKSKVQKKYP